MGYPLGAQYDPAAPWNQPEPEIMECEACHRHHPEYDFIKNTEDEFICPDCAASQKCEWCDSVDPGTEITTYDGEVMRLCPSCKEAMK